jgi:hypothetical protein
VTPTFFKPANQLKRQVSITIECDLIAGAVVELGDFRAFVVGDLLGLLDGAAVFQVGCDAGAPEGMVANCRARGAEDNGPLRPEAENRGEERCREDFGPTSGHSSSQTR